MEKEGVNLRESGGGVVYVAGAARHAERVSLRRCARWHRGMEV